MCWASGTTESHGTASTSINTPFHKLCSKNILHEFYLGDSQLMLCKQNGQQTECNVSTL